MDMLTMMSTLLMIMTMLLALHLEHPFGHFFLLVAHCPKLHSPGTLAFLLLELLQHQQLTFSLLLVVASLVKPTVGCLAVPGPFLTMMIAGLFLQLLSTKYGGAIKTAIGLKY
jgi:hypothetical protein